MPEKAIVLGVFVLVFGLILYRKVPIYMVSLVGAAILVALRLVPLVTAVAESINWDVLALYFGYGMLAAALRESNLPKAIAGWVLPRFRKEKYALLFLCALAAALSSFMANPVVVLMLAPLAMEIAERLGAPLFLYMVGLAIASNVVTTVSMVADPPSLILAMETGLGFLDFYWFRGRPGLGTLSIVGVLVALATLLFQFRSLNGEVSIVRHRVSVCPVSKGIMGGGALACAGAITLGILRPGVAPLALLSAASLVVCAAGRIFDRPAVERSDELVLSLGPTALFLLSVVALSIAPGSRPQGFWGLLSVQGWVGLVLGVLSLLMLGGRWIEALKDFDWASMLFLVGIFVVIASVDRVGLLRDFSGWLAGLGLSDPLLLSGIITWLSVLLSSFIDNVPYTVLMIPVCSYLAASFGVSPFFFYFGMLVGTGIGGNITPVGATANVLACGMLEKRGYRIELRRYLRISVPFSCAAVLATELPLILFWGR